MLVLQLSDRQGNLESAPENDVNDETGTTEDSLLVMLSFIQHAMEDEDDSP